MDFFKLEPEKYYSWPSSYDKGKREERLIHMIASGNYLWSMKTDGNYARFVCQNGIQKLQTRGISKKTGTYGEIQTKVFFFDRLAEVFKEDTIILGEVFLEGAIDKDVGAVLRCLDSKARERQREKKLKFRIFDVWYYNGKNLMDAPILERSQYIKKAVEILNNPLIVGVKYFELDESFYEKLGEIFANGGEGAVLYEKSGKPAPGARTAWKTLKIKQELQEEIDCFIYGIEPAIREYTGKYIETCQFWEDIKTGEKFNGEYFATYKEGNSNLEPISKGYYYGWAGAIYCAVYDENHSPYILCKVAGLTDKFKEELKNNYEEYHLMPIKITGMMLSTDKSVRHPRILSLRTEDISADDCTLEKVLG